MTREEVIEVNKILDYAEKVNGVAYKALKKALEQEPCEDAISRQAVLDVWHTSYSDNREENEEIQYKKIAFELPSINPQEPKWISVNERLPGEDKAVIASTEYGVYPEAKYTKEYGWEWAYESGADYWRKLEGVTAWMPLPKPYEAESEEV